MRTIAWLAGVVVSILIIASRKHYTVDIVVAWYAVPLVFYTLHRRWTTKRPMSELLVALGENDEPDPGQAENGTDTTHTQDQVSSCGKARHACSCYDVLYHRAQAGPWPRLRHVSTRALADVVHSLTEVWQFGVAVIIMVGGNRELPCACTMPTGGNPDAGFTQRGQAQQCVAVTPKGARSIYSQAQHCGGCRGGGGAQGRRECDWGDGKRWTYTPLADKVGRRGE